MGRLRAVPDPIAIAGDLVVERDPRRPSGRLLRQGAMDASYIDLADPTHLEFDYLRWMRVILRAAHARRILHIGGAGCALPRALAAEDPQGRQDVCERDGAVLELARRHLGLRRMPGLRVREVDGRTHLEQCADAAYDAIAIDAFEGARVPAALISAEAMATAARVAPLTIVNVVDDRRGAEIAAIAAALSESYPRVWAFGGRVGNNLVAGDRHGGALDLDRIAAAIAADPSPARLTAPRAMAQRIGGLVARRDAG